MLITQKRQAVRRAERIQNEAIEAQNKAMAKSQSQSADSRNKVLNSSGSRASSSNVNYDLQMAAMDVAQKELKDLKTDVDRLAAKRDRFLPQFLPFVEAYIIAGENYANEIFVWCIIWLIDVGSIEKALGYLMIALAQKQPMPEKFERDLQSVAVWELYGWFKDCADRGESAEPYFSTVLSHILDDSWKENEQVKINYLKLAADFARLNDDDKAEFDFLQAAQNVNGSAGVKTRLGILAKKLGTGT
jgi:hypothetical protein